MVARIKLISIILFMLTTACSQALAVDSSALRDTTSQEQPASAPLNERLSYDQKSASFDRVDYIIRWGIPSLLVGLIIWLLKTVFQQHETIMNLRNEIKRSASETQPQEIEKFKASLVALETENRARTAIIQSLKDQSDKLEFLCLREKLYRELEIQFMHWQGLANCIVFAEKEKQTMKRLKLFTNDRFETWLTPLDRLLLSLYFEIVENDAKKALQMIETLLSQPEVSEELKASCLLQQARIHREHRNDDVHSIFKLLEQASDLSPNNISPLFLHAKIRYDIGDYKIAAKILEQARNVPNANLFPIIINLTLADVYIKIRKFKEALRLVESYLIFHPYHVKSIKSKASIFCADRSINEATVEQFREQIQAINVGDDPELHFTIALLDYRLKKNREAEERLTVNIIKRPSFIEYRALLANIYFELNREDELLKTLDIIKTLVTDGKVKTQVDKVIGNIERKGIEEAKKTGRFDIPLIY